MEINEAIKGRRTIRKFSSKPISVDTLKELIEGATLAPSAANLQPLKYIIITEKESCKDVFELTKWAGYLKEGNPKEGFRPVAWVIVLNDPDICKKGYERDVGAAVQNMLLLAWSKGIGSCWIGSVDRDELRILLEIEDKYIIDSVIAFGYPKQKSVSEDSISSIKYYLDEKDILHVPKRKIDEVLIKEK